MPSNSNNYNYQITCEVDERLILDSIDFSVYPNNILLIIGPGGSGKSTLLSILEGNSNSELCLTVKTGNPIPIEKIGILHQSSSLPLSFVQLIPEELDPIKTLNDFWSDLDIIEELIEYADHDPNDVPKWIKRIYLFTDFVLRHEDKEFWFLDEPEQGI